MPFQDEIHRQYAAGAPADRPVQPGYGLQRSCFSFPARSPSTPSAANWCWTDIETETHRVLQNVQAILEAAGSSLQQVLKATVFVKDMNMFGRINAVYGTYFQPEFAPARELVQVSELPKYCNIEISVVAVVG